MNCAVVIPTKGRTELLLKAVRLMQNQTTKPNEIIIVVADPCEEEEIIDKIAKLKPEIETRIICTGHPLLSGSARNIGWQSCSKDIIFFLDDDDYFAELKIERHLKFHAEPRNKIKTTADVVYSGVFYFFNERDIRPKKPIHFSSDVAMDLLKDGFCPPTTSCLSFSRAALAQCGGFDESLPAYEDWELLYRMARGSFSFECIEETLTYFVQHNSSRVSMNTTRLAAAAEIICRKFDNSQPIYGFFKREARHSSERRIVFASKSDLSESFRDLYGSLQSGMFSFFEWRTFWILTKIILTHVSSTFKKSPN